MQDVELEPERARRRQQVVRLRLGNRVGRVEQQRNRIRRRHKLMKKLQPLLPRIDIEADNAGHVSAWPIEARDEPSFDGINAAVGDDRKRDELATLYVEHRGLPPLCVIAAAEWPMRPVFCRFSLPQGGRQVLGAELKCSESKRGGLPLMCL